MEESKRHTQVYGTPVMIDAALLFLKRANYTINCASQAHSFHINQELIKEKKSIKSCKN